MNLQLASKLYLNFKLMADLKITIQYCLLIIFFSFLNNIDFLFNFRFFLKILPIEIFISITILFTHIILLIYRLMVTILIF